MTGLLDRSMQHVRWLVPIGFALAAGCGSPATAPAPRLETAARQTHAAESAYLNGRTADAVTAFADAARLQMTAGDLPGAARSLLNLALAQRSAGIAAAAQFTAGQLRELTPAAQQQARERPANGTTAAVELGAAAGWLDALLALDRGEVEAANAALASVDVKLPATSPWPGRVATLRAQAALATGRIDETITQARIAQAACAAAHDPSEEARAQRLAGAAFMRRAQWAEAKRYFLAAVQLEQSLGAGERMAGDLNRLAEITTQLGDADNARLYAARARAIGSAR
jgi:tetratricopeptide (TPR) repeat protein